MPDHEKYFVGEKQIRILMRVNVGHVIRVITLALQPAHELHLVSRRSVQTDKISSAIVSPIWAIEGHLITGFDPTCSRIQRAASPLVIRLISCNARLNEYRRISGIVAH